jgi:hypothetical protein
MIGAYPRSADRLARPTVVTDRRPEVALLLSAARARVDGRDRERLRTLLDEPIDWMAWIRLALSHDVLALASTAVMAVSRTAIPEAMRGPLVQAVRRRADRNRQLTSELLAVLALLESHGIAAVPVKGPVIGTLAYGDAAARECDDLDFLIHRRDAARAKRVLCASGYVLETPLNARDLPTDSDNQEYRFRRRDTDVLVELRWRITPRHFVRTMDLDAIGARRRTISLSTTQVVTLPPEEHLLILCVHGSKHMWCLLRWICDVAELLRACPSLSWRRVEDLAAKLGCWRSVALGIVLAHELLDAPLPDRVRDRATHDPRVRTLASWVQHHLFDDAPPHVASADDREEILGQHMEEWRRRQYYIRLADRLWDRVWSSLLLASWALSLVIRPSGKDRVLVRLPRSLSFLYILLRLPRLMIRYGIFWGARSARAGDIQGARVR